MGRKGKFVLRPDVLVNASILPTVGVGAMTGGTFSVTCIHCEVTVLITPQIQAAEYDRLVRHLTTVHPTVPFFTATLTRVLDHFVVRPEPGVTGGPR